MKAMDLSPYCSYTRWQATRASRQVGQVMLQRMITVAGIGLEDLAPVDLLAIGDVGQEEGRRGVSDLEPLRSLDGSLGATRKPTKATASNQETDQPSRVPSGRVSILDVIGPP